jgi:hypothetical protein
VREVHEGLVTGYNARNDIVRGNDLEKAYKVESEEWTLQNIADNVGANMPEAFRKALTDANFKHKDKKYWAGLR